MNFPNGTFDRYKVFSMWKPKLIDLLSREKFFVKDRKFLERS